MSRVPINGSPRTESYEFINLGQVNEPDSPDLRPTSVSGPWTNPPDAYSQKIQTRESSEERRKLPKRKFCLVGTACVIVFVIGISLGIIIGHYALGKVVGEKDSQSGTTYGCRDCQSVSQSCVQCKKRNPVEVDDAGPERSLFRALTEKEIENVQRFMKENNYISTRSRLSDDRLMNMFLYPVNKTEALDHLDNGGPFPGRYAMVTIMRGSKPQPDVMDYKVGPLGSANLTAKTLREDGEIAFNRRPFDAAEMALLHRIVRRHVTAISSLLRECFDGAYVDKGVSVKFILEPVNNLTDRVSQMQLHLSLPSGNVLHLLPVSGYVHHPGTDMRKWYLSEMYYLSQGPFVSGEELQTAYNNGSVRKIQLPDGYRSHVRHNYDLVQNTSAPKRPFSDLPPPVTHQPLGPRYSIKGTTVRFMDWEFDVTHNPRRGPAIFNVRFKGERIAYEISLQDITLNYAKQSNGGAPTVLSDTHFYLGNFYHPLVGMDCPEEATILKATIQMFYTTRTREAMCVFEATSQRPKWRHGMKGLVETYLVLRAPLNMGNYDYTLEWQFHLDGSVQTMISASGYLYGAFFDPDDPLVNSDKSTTPFGFKLSDYFLGPIHDHTFSFKVDIDVLGVENSFRFSQWKTGDPLIALQTQTNITKAPGYFRNNIRYLEHNMLETEKGFIVDPKHPQIWSVVNENEHNKWGVVRGYRITTHSTAAETFSDDYVMLDAWEHLKYHVAVTKRKESEQFLTESLYDLTHPSHAIGGLGKMLDSEPCSGSDLVLWVSEKFMHAPSAEDLPMTLQVHRAFTLQPFNYFDRTSVFDLKAHYSRDQPKYTESCPTS